MKSDADAWALIIGVLIERGGKAREVVAQSIVRHGLKDQSSDADDWFFRQLAQCVCS